MTDSRELRKRAAQYRQAASTRTVGGHETDRHLREVASSLEALADEIERKKASVRSSDSDAA
jgi:hypothetical protein